ncbi:MAG: transporter substrate-binding protein [Bacteroidetes bacterium]|jgi:phospholipid/cholesterol/gamma-HCH transport system substrate-binding protein|nr:transporter substrate-binding protein [Bacteroidota bacterium]
MKLSNEVKVGIAVFIAIIIFFAGVMYLRGIDFQKKEYTLTILYDNVNGLKAGSPITVAGYTVGRVEEMLLHGAEIAVQVSLESKVLLAKDSRATIKSASIMGGKYIAITPGASPEAYENGDTLRGTYQADLTELTSTLAPISSNVLGILENVNKTFDEKTRRGLQDIVVDVNNSTSELEQIIRSQGGRVNYVIGNLSTMSENLARFSTGLDTIGLSQRAKLDSSLTIVRAIAKNLEEASEDLKSTTSSLDAIAQRIEMGEGTIGKLSRDPRLYNNLDSVASNLNALIIDLRENPSRYVRLSLF